MSREWDKENMRMLGTNLRKETAEKFKAYAAENGTTVGALLRGFVEATVSGRPSQTEAPLKGVEHIVSFKNTDRLKREVAVHNPRHLDPNGMLNAILDDYFAFVKRVRE